MRLIAKLDTVMSIQLANAARLYAEQLEQDADTYTRNGSEACAVDAKQTAEKMRKLADDIDCDPIEIHAAPPRCTGCGWSTNATCKTVTCKLGDGCHCGGGS